MKIFTRASFGIWMVLFFGTEPVLTAQESQTPVLRARIYNSHFPKAAGLGESYNGIGESDNGTIYYTIDSRVYNIPGQMYSLNPKTGQITHIADLNTATGQGNIKAVAQGKVHVDFMEYHGKFYFSTHLGYYNESTGIERRAAPPDGFKPYPGGHFVSYDLRTKMFDSLALAPHGEGIIAFNMDGKRGRLYGLTWPSGDFLRFDLNTRRLKDLGSFFQKGEAGTIGSTYRAICRRIVLDPDNGNVYWTTGDGAIHEYIYKSERVGTVPGVSLRKDYFGQFDPSKLGMAYNWRAAVWDPNDHMIYAVNGASGYLFRFDPATRSVRVLRRLTSLPSQASGMFDEVQYGYLGLALDARTDTLYYLTGSPLPPGSGLPEGSHLITYDIATGRYKDHGEIMLDDDKPAGDEQAIAIGQDGTIYTLTQIHRHGRLVMDLISFHP
jgi:hypothetical protein